MNNIICKIMYCTKYDTVLNIILQFWCPAVQPGFVQLSSIILYYTTRYCTVATRKVSRTMMYPLTGFSLPAYYKYSESCLPEQADPPNESDEDNEEMVEKEEELISEYHNQHTR